MSPAGPLWELVGGVAATLTTLAFVPQVWLAWRSEDLAGVSLGMYLMLTLGIALWLLYGLALGAWPLILANAVCLLLGLAMVWRLLRWRQARRRAGRGPA